MSNRRRLLQLFLAPRAVKINTRVRKTIEDLTPVGKILLFVCTVGLIVSTGALTYKVYTAASTEVPSRGGEIREGILGTPRFVNPLFALGHADHDLVELVYAGLFTYSPEGKIVPELADRYAISDSGKTYTVSLKEAYFHDGEKVTADDVVYTIHQAQNPLVKSTVQGNWNGVSVRALDEYTVEFTLSESYGPFIHNLTIGILPAHIWEPLGPERLAFSEENITPIGAGPYVIRSAQSSRDGTRTYYTLSSFEDYVLGEALIPRIELSFFADRNDLESAYRRGRIASSPYLSESFIAESVETRPRIFPIRRVFALFFNQTEEGPLAQGSVRNALDRAAGREFLARTVFSGFATPIDTPYPFLGTTYQEREGSGRDILEEAGWEIDETTGIRTSEDTSLSFTLSTAQTPELTRTAEILERNFENIGVEVTLKTYSTEALLGEVIRPRTYDALLFGYVVGRDNDLFGYWHSSQRNDPGLNMALYSNERVDELLVEMRGEPTEETYRLFNEEVAEDLPALFLYRPDLPYVLPKSVSGVSTHDVVAPHERFIDIHEWYIQTRRLWNIFSS